MKKIKVIGMLAFALVVSFSSCQKASKSTTLGTETQNVNVEPVIEKDVELTNEVTATIQPDAKNSIAPAAPGRIRSILVEVGQHVTKGQKLVQMDVANLSNMETQIENQKRISKRVQELFNVGGASQQELDNAKMQLEVAQTNLKNMSENTYLLSPISGVVTARNYDNGDMYSGQTPVLTVMNINPVKVLVNVSESNYSQVKIGMSIDVKFDVLNGQTFKGHVNLIYPTIDERTRTFGVEIKLNNPNDKIRPGMFARVTLNFGKVKRILVPDKAVVKQAGSGAKFVFVYNAGKVQYKQVEIGRRIESSYEILSGVTAGDQVVVAGQAKLVDGSSVQIVK